MATTYVSGGGTALANAINATSAGDVLVVADGVYSPWTGNGKNITVVSEHGPANCIIDGGCVWQDGIVGGTLVTQGIRCISNYGTRIVFRGLTLRNGGNFENDGQANAGFGGGAYGGKFQKCIFKDNYCWKEGGGCSSAETFRCEFVGNIALVAGAAILSNTHTFDYIHDNGRIGTGTYCGACYTGDYFGCLIVGNISSGQGAGAMLGNLVNCTIAGNASTVKNGYGVMLNNGNYSSMHNCIVFGNTTTNTASDKSEFYASSTVAFQVTDSCLPENSAIGQTVETSGNILADPMFVGNGDYRLTALSPCIGRAVATWMNNDEDFSGRYWKALPSLGCYEYYLQTEPRIPNGINPLGVPKTVLPYDAEVEYLTTDGDCWIDTGITPLLTDTVEFGKLGSGNNNFGTVGASWRQNAFALYSWQFWLGDSATSSIINPGGDAIWKIEDGKLYKDGTLLQDFSDATGDPIRPIYLFALHDYNASPTYKMASGGSIVYYKLIRNGVVIQDLIPVRKNGVGYFYDKVTGGLLGNKGTGTLTYGADK